MANYINQAKGHVRKALGMIQAGKWGTVRQWLRLAIRILKTQRDAGVSGLDEAINKVDSGLRAYGGKGADNGQAIGFLQSALEDLAGKGGGE